MAAPAKESISEAKTSGALCGSRYAVLPFMVPDVDVVLKPLIQKPCSYPQLNQHPILLYRFPSQGFAGYSPPADDFSPRDGFPRTIAPLVFPPCFLIEFRMFHHQTNTHGFLLSFLLGLESFFPNAMISNA